jgi:phage terminase large subunit-like protein
MWVDAPQIWIPNEIWMQNKVETIPLEVFTKNTSYAGVDLSSTTDISAFIILSEPDSEGKRYVKPFFFCPKDTVDRRSKEDRVPYRYWVDAGYMIATPGNRVDYDYIEDKICEVYHDFKIDRIEYDDWNARSLIANLQNKEINVSVFLQGITIISAPTKEFEKLVYEGKIIHDGNPVLSWMLASCVIYRDANDNIKVHKGQSHASGRRVDGIVAIIMALGGSMSPEEKTSKYSKPMDESEIYI